VRPVCAIVANDVHFVKLVHRACEQSNRPDKEQNAFEEHDKVFSDQRACISEHLPKGPYLLKL
jgi:hypothetical protein